MLILNGKKFARTESEFVSSLFEAGGTCVGYYKATARQIFLMNHQKERVGVISPSGVLASATRQPDGRYWYSYGKPALVGEYASHAQEREECRAALDTLCSARKPVLA